MRETSVEHLEHAFRGPRDDRPRPPDHDRPLHELGVLQEKLDHLLPGRVVLGLQPELVEALVLADEVTGRAGEQREEAVERRTIQRLLQVLDDVARDAALAQDVQRAARLPSAGVVVDGHAIHVPDLARKAVLRNAVRRVLGLDERSTLCDASCPCVAS